MEVPKSNAEKLKEARQALKKTAKELKKTIAENEAKKKRNLKVA